MPEEIKLSHQDSSVYSDPNDGDLSRSENSSCSDESVYCKQNGHETVEIIPTRTIKTSVPKPAANPLQFVKIGPCDLYRSAQKQLQKVSEIKKPKKEIKDEMEDWQSNLDSWKCNRRKQQEHIIERVVEVKKLELEEHDRNRKRTKTFSEMMEERTSKGRKLSLPLYLEEDDDDLSELGISSSKSGVKSATIPEENDDKDENDKSFQNGDCNNCAKNSNRVQENGGSTYESAIQSYEIRMKSLTNGECKKSTAVTQKFGRRGSAAKIEEKLCELERIKNRSISTIDLTDTNKKQISIPKVNIFRRKEMFEKICDANDSCKSRTPSDDLPPVRSIKERLSSLEKQMEDASNKSKNLLLTEVSVKDRLSSINEKIRQQSVPTSAPEKPAVIRERLSLTNSPNVEFEKDGKSKEYSMYDTGASKNEDVLPTSNGREYSSSGRSSSSEDYEHVPHQVNHFHHRSLDSLQDHDSPNGFCFERVQSLECIDCCSNYPASVLSGDTDREDSGIHTADVSSSVSQADDFDLHPDSSMDVTDMKTQHSQTIIGTNETKVEKSSHSNDFCFISENGSSSPEDDGKRVDINKLERNQNETESRNLIEVEVQNRFREREDFRDVMFEEDHSHVEDVTIVDRKSSSAVGNDTLHNSSCENGVSNIVEDQISCASAKTENAADVCDSALETQNSSDFILRESCRSTTKVENEYYDNNLNKEESVNSFSENHFGKPLQVNQNFIESEREYTYGITSSAVEPNMEYNYSRNCNFAEDMPDGITKSGSVFAFESSTAVEPPKEKPPPPPPCDNSEDEYDEMTDSGSLRRMDSTKRIKKEIRQKRSSFLGIEDFNDDSYLEPELESVKRPPDMTTFLQEERRLEKLLYRQSICSESDSTQGESRDSGVELDKNQMDEGSWITDGVHSRQDSETYANTSTTSEEDEIIKKEREILEILELEEQRHYAPETKSECNNLGEKLVLKLKELERQKNVCWNRGEEQRLHDQCKMTSSHNYQTYEEPLIDTKIPVHETNEASDLMLLQQQWSGRSLQDVTQEAHIVNTDYSPQNIRDYRSSMPNIQQELTMPNPYHRVPPPIPPNKPAHFREPPSVNKVSNSQQMSRQTLQALSAVPRSKIITTDSWVLSKKKPRQETCNYQHWLIQEAEHRRITEYQQRYSNDNLHNNYVNVHADYSESAMLKDVESPESRISAHTNRSLYAHPQMLPNRNRNQIYGVDKNHAKPHHKPLPDSVIQTLTQRVQNRFAINDATKQRRRESYPNVVNQQEKMLSVSGKKKCSHCGEELGRGAAMIIESLRLFYHIDCFKCCVCCVQLGDGLIGTDVRVRNSKLHCHSCYSNDEGLKFSCV